MAKWPGPRDSKAKTPPEQVPFELRLPGEISKFTKLNFRNFIPGDNGEKRKLPLSPTLFMPCSQLSSCVPKRAMSKRTFLCAPPFQKAINSDRKIWLFPLFHLPFCTLSKDLISTRVSAPFTIFLVMEIFLSRRRLLFLNDWEEAFMRALVTSVFPMRNTTTALETESHVVGVISKTWVALCRHSQPREKIPSRKEKWSLDTNCATKKSVYNFREETARDEHFGI